MKGKEKIIISTLVLALLAAPLVQANNIQEETTIAPTGVVEQHLDGSIVSSYYKNPENGWIYLTSPIIKMKFRAWADSGSPAVKTVQVYDASKMRFIREFDLEDDGTITLDLENDVIKPDPLETRFFEDFRVIQYTGLNSQGQIAVYGKTNYKIEGTNEEVHVVRVDTKAPRLNYWEVKQNFWGKTKLIVEADDKRDLYSHSHQVVSGLEFVRVYIPGKTIDIINFTIYDSREENIDLHPGSKGWVGKFDLHDNIVHAMLCSGFVVETRDWAGQTPGLEHVPADQIDIPGDDDDDDVPKAKFLTPGILELIRAIFNRFPLLKLLI